jgi:hypothetical protein
MPTWRVLTDLDFYALQSPSGSNPKGFFVILLIDCGLVHQRRIEATIKKGVWTISS